MYCFHMKGWHYRIEKFCQTILTQFRVIMGKKSTDSCFGTEGNPPHWVDFASGCVAILLNHLSNNKNVQTD